MKKWEILFVTIFAAVYAIADWIYRRKEAGAQ